MCDLETQSLKSVPLLTRMCGPSLRRSLGKGDIKLMIGNKNVTDQRTDLHVQKITKPSLLLRMA